MKSGNKLWSTLVDYFLIMGAIVGVGFASGKETYVFFFNFGGGSLIGLLSFGLLYVYLFLIIQYVSNKLQIKSYNEFNNKLFGKMCKISQVFLLINFVITSAGMLAGADYLFQTFFGIEYRIPSIIMSVATFLLLLGGIDKIKTIANIIVPLMLAVIIINSLKNITPSNVCMEITTRNGFMAIYYGILFGVNNFVAAMPMLFETKMKTKGKLFVVLSICVVILLNILVFASNKFSTDMPMFELSLNVSKVFYYVYFSALILALFSTLIICSYNTYNIISKGKKSLFLIGIIVLINLIISNLKYSFIVQYLYVVSAVISALYVLIIIMLIIGILIRKNKQGLRLKSTTKLMKTAIKNKEKRLIIKSKMLNLKIYKNM